MSPKVDVDELVSGAEIGRRLKLSPQRVHQLRSRDDFPAAVGKIGRSLIWRWADVEKWAKKRKV